MLIFELIRLPCHSNYYLSSQIIVHLRSSNHWRILISLEMHWPRLEDARNWRILFTPEMHWPRVGGPQADDADGISCETLGSLQIFSEMNFYELAERYEACVLDSYLTKWVSLADTSI